VPEGIDALLGVEVERDVVCTLRDGVVLRADVYRPLGGGSHPLLLLRTPYDKSMAQADGFGHPSWYARQGYVVVIQDTRGCHTSDGNFYPFLTEAEDGYDTIEWAAGLPGSNGRVGMYGFSYPGAVQLLAATLQPPSLVTICPSFTGAQYYDGWTYNQGAFALAFAAPWAAGLALDAAHRTRDEDGMRALLKAISETDGLLESLPIEAWPPVLERHAPYFTDWLDHPTYDAYWQRWSIDRDYSRLIVPALHIGGWYDSFLSGTVKNFAGLSAGGGSPKALEGQKLVIGPWYHVDWGPVDWPGNPEGDESAGWRAVDAWQLRWFDRFLKEDESASIGAPVTVYILGEGWRDFDSWPPSISQEQRVFLHSGGSANSSQGDGVLSTAPPGTEPADVYVYDPLMVAARPGGHSCCEPSSAPVGPACQCTAEASRAMLVYTTAPLERDLVLAGNAHATLYAASSALDTDFAVRLCVVDAGGCSRNVQEGIVRARFRDSLSDPTPIEPGRVYRYEIELGPVGVRVRVGECLRVDVASSDFPQWDRNLNTGGDTGREAALAAVVATQVVLHDAEHPSCVSVRVLDA
jgi:putative CocE/NonD family hydrolase